MLGLILNTCIQFEENMKDLIKNMICMQTLNTEQLYKP